MARICILDKNTNRCINVIEEDHGNWVNHAEFIAAPRNDGQIGWVLQEDGSWHNPNEIVLTSEQLWGRLRSWRNKKLMATDLYMLSDFPITTEQRTALLAYRQALRDLTDVVTEADLIDLKQLNWPEKPDFIS